MFIRTEKGRRSPRDDSSLTHLVVQFESFVHLTLNGLINPAEKERCEIERNVVPMKNNMRA